MSTVRLVLFVVAVIALTSLAHAQTEKVIYSFANEQDPLTLVQSADGNLYGEAGGQILRLNSGSGVTPFFTFSCTEGNSGTVCPDGSGLSSLIQGGDGNFYGLTSRGGGTSGTGGGTFFRVSPAGVLTTLYSFPDPATASVGSSPAALIEGSDGNFYGVTQTSYMPENEPEDEMTCGTVFRVTPSGTLQTLQTLTCEGDYFDREGTTVPTGIVQASDGNYYGDFAGSNDCIILVSDSQEDLHSCGAIYKVTPQGAVSTFFTFSGEEGTGPQNPMIEGSDGALYGAAQDALTPAPGSVFRISLAGQVTTLHQFMNSDGYVEQNNGLFPGSDGNLYGFTAGGGTTAQTFSAGTAYRLGIDGSGFTTLYNFCSVSDSESYCNDGDDPAGTPLQASDGNFYGDTFVGGTNLVFDQDIGNGIYFELTPPTPLPAPVLVSPAKASVVAGSSVTVDWSASNAYSLTMQQCYAFSTLNGSLTALGKLTGALASGVFVGSFSYTPPSAGTYLLAVTCGGIESGFASLTATPALPITFTSVTHNFGTYPVGSSSTYGVKVTNPNSSAFPFALHLSGAASFTSVNGCGSSLAANSSCEIIFTFAPTATGTQTSAWSLTAGNFTFSPSNGGTLTGTGVTSGNLNFTTSIHNFGTMPVNSTSASYGTVLTNSYNYPVTLAYTMSGTTASFGASTTCGATLGAGQSCNANFSFAPKTTGLMSETIGVTASYKGTPVPITSLGSAITGLTLRGTGQ